MIHTETTRTVAIVVGNRKIRADRADVLGLAFGHLPHVDQRVLWLTAIDRLTAAKAADVLGLTPAELGQISFRARDRLRRRMTALLRTRAPEPCREFVADLAHYALGAASDLRAPRIRGHVSECAGCRVIVHAFVDLPAALRARPPVEPPGVNFDPSPGAAPAARPEPASTPWLGAIEAPASPPDRLMRNVALGLTVAVLLVVGAAGLVRATRSPDAGLFASSDPFLAPAPGATTSFDTGTPRPVSDDTEVRGIVIAAAAPPTAAPSPATPAADLPSGPGEVPETPPPAPAAPEESTNPALPAGAVAETVAIVDTTVDDLTGVLASVTGVLEALLGR